MAPKNFISSPKELPTLGRRRQTDGFWPGRRGPDMWNELGRQAEARINSTIITRTNANPQKAENFTEYKARLTVLTAGLPPTTLKKMTAGHWDRKTDMISAAPLTPGPSEEFQLELITKTTPGCSLLHRKKTSTHREKFETAT